MSDSGLLKVNTLSLSLSLDFSHSLSLSAGDHTVRPHRVWVGPGPSHATQPRAHSLQRARFITRSRTGVFHERVFT